MFGLAVSIIFKSLVVLACVVVALVLKIKVIIWLSLVAAVATEKIKPGIQVGLVLLGMMVGAYVVGVLVFYSLLKDLTAIGGYF